MKNKLRSLTALLAVVLCASMFSIPAYAQSDEPETDPVPVENTEPEPTTPNPFTPAGTGTVIDNATSEDEKEFYTIMTPDENVFYLVIDKQRDADNVYFLNAVTESDLMALAAKDGTSTTAKPEEPEPAPAPAPQTEEPATEEPQEPEQPKSQGTSPVMMVLIGVAALAVGGLGYYFKIYKRKHELDDADDIDEFEFEGPEEPTVREEDMETAPELTAQEEAEQRRLYEEERDESEEIGDDPVQ